MAGVQDQDCHGVPWRHKGEVPLAAVAWSEAVSVEPLYGILNAILGECDQIFGQLGGDWEVELRGPHKDVEGFKIKPLLRDIRGSNCFPLPVVNSLKEGGKIITNIFQ